MNFSLPPHYVAMPAWVILSAFDCEPPKSALLGRYNRLLSLAWDREDKSTPVMREEDLYNTKGADGQEIKGFLDLSRRQFYEIVHEMEGMRWLRPARPRAGFVQFFFHGVDPEASAENSTVGAKNRTELMIDEEESFKLLNKESSSSSSKEKEAVRKIALNAKSRTSTKDRTTQTDSEKKMTALIENLHLLFDPEQFGVLEMREIFLAGSPERALGWIAKAYQDRERLVQGGGAIGLIVSHLLKQDAPHRYYLENYVKVLPESFLEAVGEIRYECSYCTESFDTRELRRAHECEKHPYPCDECDPPKMFRNADELKAHYEETHDPLRVRKPAEQEVIPMPVLDGSIEKAWQSVLAQLQQEMPRASFETWVRDTRAIRYDRNTVTLTVGVHNTYAQDWLSNRLASTMERLLIGILNQEVSVVFEVADLDLVESE